MNNQNTKLMTETEMREFLLNLLFYETDVHFALDGLIFLFTTFSEIGKANHVEPIDLADRLVSYLYSETFDSNKSSEKYREIISEKYREQINAQQS